MRFRLFYSAIGAGLLAGPAWAGALPAPLTLPAPIATRAPQAGAPRIAKAPPSEPAPQAPTPAAPRAPLYRNFYLQTHDVSAHAVVRNGEDGRPARVIVANPAGNTGVGLWTGKLAPGEPGLRVERPLERTTHEGATGVSLAMSGPSKVKIDRLFLDSVRTLRSAEHNEEAERKRTVDDAIKTFSAWGPQRNPQTEALRQTVLTRLTQWFSPERIVDPKRPSTVILQRHALGSGARYRVELTPGEGTTIAGEGSDLTLSAPGRTSFQLRSFIDRPSLSPIDHVFEAGTKAHGPVGHDLRFLSTKDKLLAGSWQYLTYFGRDTLITSALLADHASGEFLSTGVGSVLDRISPHGEVAHEEDIGDQATLANLAKLTTRMRTEGRAAKVTAADVTALEKPIYDYKMIDGEYLLPQLLTRFVTRLDPQAPHDKRLLGQTFTPARLGALARVIARIDDQTAHASEGGTGLISLHPDQPVGTWRDSNEGLGGGRTPLDVNLYLVPSALGALHELVQSPGFPKERLLAEAGDKRAQIAKLLEPRTLETRARAWRQTATRAFDVKVGEPEARARLASFVDGMAPEERRVLGAQRLFGSNETVAEALASHSPALANGARFSALSLDRDGKPVPVLSTDGFVDLFYGSPTKDELLSEVKQVFQPYPIGLATPVGLVAANPAYSNRPSDIGTFARDKYHGAVVWGWQQQMMRKGLERQLGVFRGDPEVEHTLRDALGVLDTADRNVGAAGRTAELWSWKAAEGKIAVVPYGAAETDATEANDRQLWSLAGGVTTPVKVSSPRTRAAGPQPAPAESGPRAPSPHPSP